MKKLQNFLLLCSITLLCSQNLIQTSNGPTQTVTNRIGGGQGFIPNTDWRTTQQQTTTSTDDSCSASGGTCCPSGKQCCASCATTSILPIAPFVVQILDKNGTPLNNNTSQTPSITPPGITLNPNSSLTTLLLIVQIFPPSNTISGSTPTAVGDKKYIIMYTIKDPSGSFVSVSYDLIPSSNGIPCIINIPTVTGSTTLAGISAMSGSTNSAASISLFGNSITIDNDKLTVLNGISSMTQKFLLTNSNSNSPQSFIITPISGISDSEIYQTFTIPGVNSLSNLSISFDGTNPLLTFAGSTIPFTASDLQKGIILNVVIYPSSSGSNYRVITTLRTTDGLKYRKQYALGNQGGKAGYGSTPSTIYITIPGNTNPFTRNFFNTNAASSVSSNSATIYPFNIIAPINLRFLITS